MEQSMMNNDTGNDQGVNDDDVDVEKGGVSHDDKREAGGVERSKSRWACASSTSGPFLYVLLVLVGAAASAIIVANGVSAAKTDQQAHLVRIEGDLLQQFKTALKAYEDSGLLLHHACSFDNINSFQDFEVMYQYLLGTGLVFHGAACVKNVTSQQERMAMEQESRDFLDAHYPGTPYLGFYEKSNNTTTGLPPVRRPEQPFYFPAHYRMPMEQTYYRAVLGKNKHTKLSAEVIGCLASTRCVSCLPQLDDSPPLPLFQCYYEMSFQILICIPIRNAAW
jgi:hypothetical protein